MLLPLIVGVLLVQTLAASPYIDSHPQPQVLNYHMDTNNMPNSYNFHYDASDGSSRTEQGAILNQGTNDAALDVHGAARWYDDKGDLYEMTYKAGKRGYRTVIKKIS
ncbi:endocuticle structural glycoprotein ABD-5-like [Ostrinia nubilalis]|uniref:endocuticle structural glycoprotein ABD-5-like n=1 Tax=Ostrinia furnacalis TaxID=93504 RepID=UPI00103C5B49|nr:endocuticle structural glycoprotein ABD-5-like [Ostrinia furnacalis]